MKYGLIVDDSAVIRKVGRRILDMLGFDSAEAADAANALEQCARLMPDVILLDWRLPASDTLATLLALRRLPGGDAAKIIYCATENDPLAICLALRARADDVLFKPFDRRAVQQKFQEVGLIA
jgi:two-component system chemotaxis response regulator CheY